MIVKNEEKYLSKCLEGLTPILNAVNSELIIFDTGSTDATVEIAKEFTSNVFEAEWRGDFAWARNHTLNKAVGEWYMQVDADEIFTDVSDLISFFNSREYKKYKSANFVLRNIHSDTVFSHCRPVRLFKMEKNTRYKGKIHEHIPYHLPQKHLESTADHYGYYNQGIEGQKNIAEKHKRNIKPLLEMYAENPNDPAIVLLITNDYSMAKDYDNHKKFLDIGIRITVKNPDDPFYHIFHTEMVRYHNFTQDYESLVSTARAYLKDNKQVNPCVVAVSYWYANALILLGKYKEAQKAGKEALKYFERNKNGKPDTLISNRVNLPWEILNNREVHAKTVVLAYSLDSQFVLAFTWIDYTENRKKIELEMFELFVSECAKKNRWHDISRLYAYGLKQGADTERYYNAIATIEKHITTPEIKQLVAYSLVDDPILVNSTDDYMYLQKLRISGASVLYAPYLNYFIRSNKQFTHFYGDVIYYALKWHQDFSVFIENMLVSDMSMIASALFQSNDNAADAFLNFIRNKTSVLQKQSIKVTRLMYIIANTAFDIERASSDDRRIEFFEASACNGHKYLKMVYRPDVYSDKSITSLPAGDGFLYYAGTAYEHRDAGDTLGFVRNLHTALKINPHAGDIIRLIVGKVSEEMKRA